MMLASSLSFLALAAAVNAHTAAFATGMYCLNGNDTAHPNLNANDPVNPLWCVNLLHKSPLSYSKIGAIYCKTSAF
jgi:hypothetical protein